MRENRNGPAVRHDRVLQATERTRGVARASTNATELSSGASAATHPLAGLSDLEGVAALGEGRESTLRTGFESNLAQPAESRSLDGGPHPRRLAHGVLQ